MGIVSKSQSRRACAELASRPSAPRSGGGAKRRALTPVSTRARYWLDDAASDHNILRSAGVDFPSDPRARQQIWLHARVSTSHLHFTRFDRCRLPRRRHCQHHRQHPGGRRAACPGVMARLGRCAGATLLTLRRGRLSVPAVGRGPDRRRTLRSLRSVRNWAVGWAVGHACRRAPSPPASPCCPSIQSSSVSAVRLNGHSRGDPGRRRCGARRLICTFRKEDRESAGREVQQPVGHPLR